MTLLFAQTGAAGECGGVFCTHRLANVTSRHVDGISEHDLYIHKNGLGIKQYMHDYHTSFSQVIALNLACLLDTLKACDRIGGAMAERRKAQNYQQIMHFLTDTVWNALEHQSRERSETLLLRHCWKLGLRCPSEGTASVLHNILILSKKNREREMSIFERHQSFQQLKQAWKRLKTVLRGEDYQYTDYVDVLPMNRHELAGEWYLAAFAEEGPADCSALP